MHIEADLGHDHVVADTALGQHLTVLTQSLDGRRWHTQQHGVIDLTSRGHGHTNSVSASLALGSALLGDTRAPLVVRACGALLGLLVLGISRWLNAIVGVAVRLLAFAGVLVVALDVEHLAGALVGF